MTRRRSEPLVERLGRYQVVDRLGMGGMAEVVLARLEGSVAFERFVAIKRLLPHLSADPELSAMFVDEAHVLSSLRHPNVVAVEDFGEVDGQLHLVMEYLEGASVAALLGEALTRPTTIDCDVAAWVVAEAAAGLHAAHELKTEEGLPLELVHRDVSPQNVFVTYDGRVKLIDFGIARWHHARLAVTRTGSFKGKLGYMAPEQLSGGPTDRRVDIFALGTVLFELLTLRRLFRRSSEGETVRAVTSEPIRGPRELRPEVPDELDRICRKALDRDPSRRYPTALHLRTELLAYLRERATDAQSALSGQMLQLFGAQRDRDLDLRKRSRSTPPPRREPSVIPALPPAFDSSSDTSPDPVPLHLAVTNPQVKLPPPRRRSGRVALTIAASTAVLLASAAAVAALAWPRVPPPQRDLAMLPVDSLAGETSNAVDRTDREPLAGETPPTIHPTWIDRAAPNEASPNVVLTIDSSPNGAAIEVDGVARGETPATVVVPRASDAVRVQLNRAGYERVAFEIVPSRDQRTVTELAPIDAPRRPLREPEESESELSEVGIDLGYPTAVR